MDNERQTKERILHTAFGLFLEKGYENTPIQAIIDAVGIAKGTFYHHYRSKEEMLVSLVEGLTQRVVDAIEPIAQDPQLPAIDKLLKVGQTAWAKKAESFDGSVLLLAKQMRSRANRRLNDAIDEISQRWIVPLFSRIIAEGADQGMFRVRHPDLVAQVAVNLLLTFRDQVTDLLIDAVENGSARAVDELIELYRVIEESLERVLGAPTGSLPLYSSIDVRAMVARLTRGGAV